MGMDWGPANMNMTDGNMTDGQALALLRRLFDRAVQAADPMRVIPAALPPRPSGRVVVVGAGKASARMAEAVESVWGPVEGLVITRYGHARPTQGIRIIEAAHPVPDAAGVNATEEMLRLLGTCGEGDFVLALISGGASALLTAPLTGMDLAEKQAINAALLASGAPIGQMNLVRKHLSRVKGGRLAAAAWPARMLALLISDVPGDDPAIIGSGPTMGEASTASDATEILDRRGITLTDPLRRLMLAAAPPPRPDDPRLTRSRTRIIAASAQSLAAAATLATEAGCDTLNLGDAIEGEARLVAADHARLALRNRPAPGARPLIILSGGEVTVTQDPTPDHQPGSGGPNAEYMLALGLALDGAPGVFALACDTDGIDGAAPVAGAIIGPDFPERARQAGADPHIALARHDAHGYFASTGGQIITGPTLTNVNDFRAILIMPAGDQLP